MRNVPILLLLAVVTVGNTGCTSCFGKVRSLFRRGAPCGTTTVAPAALGAPLVMQAPTAVAPPVMQAPMAYQAAPMQCMPCQETCPPCGDTCGDCGNCGCGTQGWVSGSSGYFGGYVGEGGAGCSDCNGGVIYDGSSYPMEGQTIEGERVNDGGYSSSMSQPTPSSSGGSTRDNDPGPSRPGYGDR
ncbi:hypothetical protein [Adhaeretor mobilis]|uniref:Uncharacterized protein n=1 Tax=Adhaeretor mobilis TaxID=1930276 RepID=A0A517MT96_9BACT|nr:hypothetical protein [Adhaeretor mobilis]QDS98106.1 hypothetical protein HG15A2_13780 [Adhaeretor mobilis]